MTLFYLYPFVLGIAMAYAYQFVNLKGSYVVKGKKFGLLAWGIHGLTSSVIIYASMAYPTGFYVSSLAGSLLYMLAAGLVIAKTSK